MKRRLAVVGVGSAGILSLCHFLTYLDNEWEVVSIHDPATGILGIGESSNPNLVIALENAFGFRLLDHLQPLNGTRKYGTMWKGWREKEFLSPLIGGNCAIHFDTHKLKEFVLPELEKRWPNKFKIVEAKVTDIRNVVNGALIEMDKGSLIFDYVIDCRGFPTDYTDYRVFDEMPINHALVHNKEIPADWGYTGHLTHAHGWMFEIPLANRQSYGYLFNNKITSIEEAKKDFAKLINVPEDQLQNIEYKFKSYYSTKVCDGRIMKNGNRAGFYEPINATSIFMYDQANRLFYNYLANHIKDTETLNAEYSIVAENVR
jgi:tryptophan halogenase